MLRQCYAIAGGLGYPKMFDIIKHTSDICCIKHVHYVANNTVCGGEKACIHWSIVVPEKAAPGTGATLRTIGIVLVDSRQ